MKLVRTDSRLRTRCHTKKYAVVWTNSIYASYGRLFLIKKGLLWLLDNRLTAKGSEISFTKKSIQDLVQLMLDDYEYISYCYMGYWRATLDYGSNRGNLPKPPPWVEVFESYEMDLEIIGDLLEGIDTSDLDIYINTLDNLIETLDALTRVELIYGKYARPKTQWTQIKSQSILTSLQLDKTVSSIAYQQARGWLK